jgi:alpha-tubulin suppressor-like RCC1 family protein
MCSTPQLTQLPNDKSPEELPHVTHLAAGNTMTIAVVAKKKIYVWGSGVGSQYRLPTLLKVSFSSLHLHFTNFSSLKSLL